MTRKRRKGDRGAPEPPAPSPATPASSKRVRARKVAAVAVAPPTRPPDLGARIRELEDRLDRMIDEHARDRDRADSTPTTEALAPASHDALAEPDTHRVPSRELSGTSRLHR